MAIQGHKDLEVWRKAMALVKSVYLITKIFPREELYSLTCQIRRSAVSVPSNIAEGRSRHSTKDFMRFIMIARGSLAELETQLLIAESLEYVKAEKLRSVLGAIDEIGRMLTGLFQKLEKKLT